jgi:hypothetical protein
MTGTQTFRKRTRTLVPVYTETQTAVTSTDAKSNTSTTRSNIQASSIPAADYDRVKKGMTLSQVESILGPGDAPENITARRFAVVNYGGSQSGVAIVYKDQRVVSKAQLGS